KSLAARTLRSRRSPALEWRQFAPAAPRAAASSLRRRPASEGERSAADRQDWEEPLEADRLDNLKPAQNDPQISERRKWRRLQSAHLRIPSAAGDINRVSPE